MAERDLMADLADDNFASKFLLPMRDCDSDSCAT